MSLMLITDNSGDLNCITEFVIAARNGFKGLCISKRTKQNKISQKYKQNY